MPGMVCGTKWHLIDVGNDGSQGSEEDDDDGYNHAGDDYIDEDN